MRNAYLAVAGMLLVAYPANSTPDGHGKFVATPIASFEEPWAMSFLPDGRLLVTEKKGRLLVVTQDGEKSEPVSGVPDVDYGGQGGFGDVVPHPDYASNGLVQPPRRRGTSSWPSSVPHCWPRMSRKRPAS